MKNLIFFFFISLGFPAHPVEPDEMLKDPNLENEARIIGKKLRCLVCQNEDIESSNADIAKDLRILVRKMLEDGKTEKDILSYVHSRYGDFVLFSPPIRYDTFGLWLIPIIFFVLMFHIIFKKK